MYNKAVEIIKVKNLSFSYREDKKVLDDISLSFFSGRHYAILGHNGSGKSTLAKLLAGLLFDKNESITINDVALNEKSIAKQRLDIGIVFQNPDNQFIGATVADDIAFGLENRAIESKLMPQMIEVAANAVGMKDYLHKEPSQLSGGQKQRVAIAGVITMNPKILILDEATAMLDPRGRDEVNNILDSMKKSNPELTIITITHDIDEALSADEIIILDNGRVACQGESWKVLSQTDLSQLHLESPFIIKLVKALKKNKIDVDAKNIDELVEKLCQ